MTITYSTDWPRHETPSLSFLRGQKEDAARAFVLSQAATNAHGRHTKNKNLVYASALALTLACTWRATIAAAISASLSAFVFSNMRLRLRLSFANSLTIRLRSALISFWRAFNALVTLGSSADARSNACCKIVCVFPTCEAHAQRHHWPKMTIPLKRAPLLQQSHQATIT